MKELILSDSESEERVLISYKGYNFEVGNYACGQYSYERKASIKLINNDLTKSHFKSVGVLKLFSGANLEGQSKADQCLIKGSTTFKECLIEAKKYIRKYIDFIKPDGENNLRGTTL